MCVNYFVLNVCSKKNIFVGLNSTDTQALPFTGCLISHHVKWHKKLNIRKLCQIIITSDFGNMNKLLVGLQVIGHTNWVKVELSVFVRLQIVTWPELSSTCHVALESCERNAICNRFLDRIKRNCDSLNCDRQKCMHAQREFYDNVPEELSMEIAFCICV